MLNIVVLVSGGGTNLQAIMDKIADGNKKAAVKKAKDNQKSIVRRAKTDAANDKKFGR